MSGFCAKLAEVDTTTTCLGADLVECLADLCGSLPFLGLTGFGGSPLTEFRLRLLWISVPIPVIDPIYVAYLWVYERNLRGELELNHHA